MLPRLAPVSSQVLFVYISPLPLLTTAVLDDQELYRSARPRSEEELLSRKTPARATNRSALYMLNLCVIIIHRYSLISQYRANLERPCTAKSLSRNFQKFVELHQPDYKASGLRCNLISTSLTSSMAQSRGKQFRLNFVASESKLSCNILLRLFL